jgi:hypothetical protein
VRMGTGVPMRKVGTRSLTWCSADPTAPRGSEEPLCPRVTERTSRLGPYCNSDGCAMSEAQARVVSLLEAFVSGADRSLRLAEELEVALDAFPDDEELQDLSHDLALYRPGGGDYLYDERAMLPRCRYALTRLGGKPAE